MLVAEVLSRKLLRPARRRPLRRPDRLARRRRLAKSREGLARAGNARVRRGMIQLAWRFLMFQKESALAKWFEARTANETARGAQDDDRRAGAQVVDRLVALRRGRDPAGRRRVVRLQGVSRNIEHRVSTETSASPPLFAEKGVSSSRAQRVSAPSRATIRGGRRPAPSHGLRAEGENGPASEELRRRCA